MLALPTLTPDGIRIRLLILIQPLTLFDQRLWCSHLTYRTHLRPTINFHCRSLRSHQPPMHYLNAMLRRAAAYRRGVVRLATSQREEPRSPYLLSVSKQFTFRGVGWASDNDERPNDQMSRRYLAARVHPIGIRKKQAHSYIWQIAY